MLKKGGNPHMALTSPIKLNIAEKLEKDKEFRKRFFRGQAQDEIAMSIRELRAIRDHMRQIDLANAAGMKQSAISRIEQADYSAWSFNTLFRIAEALGARLRVNFEPVENVIDQYKEKEAGVTSQHKQFAAVHSSNTPQTTVKVRPELEQERHAIMQGLVGISDRSARIEKELISVQ